MCLPPFMHTLFPTIGSYSSLGSWLEALPWRSFVWSLIYFHRLSSNFFVTYNFARVYFCSTDSPRCPDVRSIASFNSDTKIFPCALLFLRIVSITFFPPLNRWRRSLSTHLSCASLMSCSPSCTGKTHELFARLEDLALQKFLIRLSSTVWSAYGATTVWAS